MFESEIINTKVGVTAILLILLALQSYTDKKKRNTKEHKNSLIDFSGGEVNLK